jgi:hypothetical protein
VVDGHLRNKTGNHRTRDLQDKVPRKSFPMRVLRVKSPKSLQEIGYDKTNGVRQDARPEWRRAGAHQGVSQQHEENRGADADANETQHLGQVGAICHVRTHLLGAVAVLVAETAPAALVISTVRSVELLSYTQTVTNGSFTKVSDGPAAAMLHWRIRPHWEFRFIDARSYPLDFSPGILLGVLCASSASHLCPPPSTEGQRQNHVHFHASRIESMTRAGGLRQLMQIRDRHLTAAG